MANRKTKTAASKSTSWLDWYASLDEAWRNALLEEGITEEPSEKQLAKLGAKKKLVLYEAGISDLRPLERLVAVEDLDLYGNEFESIRSLGGLTRLRRLRLGNCNSLESLAPVAKLTQLEWLDATCPGVTDFSHIRKLRKLKYLLIELDQSGSDWQRKEIAKLEKAMTWCKVQRYD